MRAGYMVVYRLLIFFFLNSHVTRWDRIRPILICSPRIPAPRGEAARPTALKTARVNRAWCSLVPLVPKNRVVKGPSRRALDGHGNLADSRVNTATHDTVAACAMSKHCTAHRSDQIRSDQIEPCQEMGKLVGVISLLEYKIILRPKRQIRLVDRSHQPPHRAHQGCESQ